MDEGINGGDQKVYDGPIPLGIGGDLERHKIGSGKWGCEAGIESITVTEKREDGLFLVGSRTIQILH